MCENDATDGLIGSHPVCATCGGSAVIRDAWAAWNWMTGKWELQATFDAFQCETCKGETQITWKIDRAFRTKRIRRLNDAFRQGDVRQGSIVITPGIQAFGEEAYATIIRQVSEFSEFTEDNDPHGEHDFEDRLLRPGTIRSLARRG